MSAPTAPRRPGRHRSDRQPSITLGPAAATWALGWVAGTLLAAPLFVMAAGASIGDDLTIPQLAAAAAGGWIIFVLALVVVSRRSGSGSLTDDFAIGFAPIDLVGVPLGIATQLLLVPALYVPLRSIWPDAFSDERIEQRAQDLADSAGGWLTVLLFVIVVLGAPMVEEVVYRGLLQRSISATIGPIGGLLATSLWFALIHLSPVEYPGLFLAGVVFGGCVLLTGRIGPAIVTHAAFNATGLVFVLRTVG